MTKPNSHLLLLGVLVVGTVALAACATTSEVEIPRQVKEEVAVACLKPEDVPDRPTLRSKADLLNMPEGLRTLATWADLWKLYAYSLRLEALVAGCSRLPRAPP